MTHFHKEVFYLKHLSTEEPRSSLFPSHLPSPHKHRSVALSPGRASPRWHDRKTRRKEELLAASICCGQLMDGSPRTSNPTS